MVHSVHIYSDPLFLHAPVFTVVCCLRSLLGISELLFELYNYSTTSLLSLYVIGLYFPNTLAAHTVEIYMQNVEKLCIIRPKAIRI